MKQCSKCKETKPKTDFSADKYQRDGLYCSCNACKSEYKSKYALTLRGRATTLVNHARNCKKGKRASLEKNLTVDDIIPILKVGVCQLTGLPFDFSKSKTSSKNAHAPSLDRIDSSKGYTKENVRVVLYLVNIALGEYSDEEALPILEAMVKGIKNGNT
jgi:hypothetical protein